MKTDRKTYKIEMALRPDVEPGHVLEIEGALVRVIDARHETDGGIYAISELQVVEPGWLWRLGYRIRRLAHRIRYALVGAVEWLLEGRLAGFM